MELGTGASAAAKGFVSDVARRSGQRPADCYQCGKCTAGCPMAFAMDIEPSRLMRLVQLGQGDAVLKSHTIWLCASCETCTTRCPQEVDLARVMDALRILAREQGHTAAEREVAILNEVILNSVKSRGRVHEMSLVMAQNLRTRHLFRDAGKAPLLLSRRKLGLRAHTSGNRDRVRALFDRVGRQAEPSGEGGDG